MSSDAKEHIRDNVVKQACLGYKIAALWLDLPYLDADALFDGFVQLHLFH